MSANGNTEAGTAIARRIAEAIAERAAQLHEAAMIEESSALASVVFSEADGMDLALEVIERICPGVTAGIPRGGDV